MMSPISINLYIFLASYSIRGQDMKLPKVIHYLCLTLILVTILTLYSFVAKIYPGARDWPEHAHVTLYLDRTFDNIETDLITKAALEWSMATNHRIEYDIIQLPTNEPMKYTDSVFVVKKSPDDTTIILMDLEGGETLGVYHHDALPSISIVSERLGDNFKEVVLHELGHSLGIKHLDGMSNLNTLMYPYSQIILDDGTILPAGADHITKKDLIAFCKIHHCDADHL